MTPADRQRELEELNQWLLDHPILATMWAFFLGIFVLEVAVSLRLGLDYVAKWAAS
jgi:hypothetical protein